MGTPQPALFRDRSKPVDVEAEARIPTVPCAACGRLGAPRVAVGIGLDIHECRSCGAYTNRWHCCGLVARRTTGAYREGAACPRCGVDRFGEQIAPSMIGVIDGAETVRSCGLKAEKGESE